MNVPAQIDIAGGKIIYHPDFTQHPIEQVFDAQYWREQDAIVGSAQGRGTTWFVDAGVEQAALRHYLRGGLFGKIVRDHYWFVSWPKTRSFAEFDLLLTLRSHGVNVPKPLAARAVKSGFVYQADILTERIADAEDLVSILQKRPISAELYQKIGREIAKMHQAGVDHTDLNIHNILIDKDEKVWIIDFDKCVKRNDSGWQEKNLERLKRSFIKEKTKQTLYLKGKDIDNFFHEYDQLKL
ncbi:MULTISPECIES: 3-deoxy-D-manno-octulosonic acid kinase [unclassified Vibrio]|uniref:3-deoxy-D-manno-octulosonic acid kinase n=1 Tax=Vibrio sp. HB236076 TaxID=3232307 RepID=A0AB39HCT6_9VIBR|nr:3-deoxy-D-manno-octulosonic acid kinase [Vibrio sp. HB161653]MDP5255403.1 3-deoxy-D-manno-octulosonic acid kinase [Vibrio sp. HB161653]